MTDIDIKLRVIDSIRAVTVDAWQSLEHGSYPFLDYAFFDALEASNATCADTGWQAQHLLFYQDDMLLAAMPAYLKQHSYGEYVFDHQWAHAYQHHGLAYYPKLVSAIPFTPATGPRLLAHKQTDVGSLWPTVVKLVKDYCREHQLSSWHILFSDENNKNQLIDNKMPSRLGVQFHWFNKAYTHFDDFLDQFTSRKRKNLRKERQQVIKQDIEIKRLNGEQISQELWEQFYYFYQITYAKRSGHGGYLNQDFFIQIGKNMPNKIMMVIAMKNDTVIAAALNFKDDDTLYGRYWGCLQEYNFLHFEVCYYQGIEYCIENKLQKFDAGAQGEHKIQRGFRPVLTYSNHYITDEQFNTAIERFLQEESEHIHRYHQQCSELLPFKQPIA